MWRVIPGDFDRKISKQKCLDRSIETSGSGTIIVFHDSQKAKEKALFTLPRYLKHFKKQGFSFNKIQFD
jgi:hypothetical protein